LTLQTAKVRRVWAVPSRDPSFRTEIAANRESVAARIALLA
jgi:hypothetical protein